jgi:ABC-type branched-subunit amino acid transport system ATPase component
VGRLPVSLFSRHKTRTGAGKTTAVRILATLLRPDGGHARVCGHDVVSHAHQVRQLTGLTRQYASMDESLTGTENLLLVGRLTGQSRPSPPRATAWPHRSPSPARMSAAAWKPASASACRRPRFLVVGEAAVPIR